MGYWEDALFRKAAEVDAKYEAGAPLSPEEITAFALARPDKYEILVRKKPEERLDDSAYVRGTP